MALAKADILGSTSSCLLIQFLFLSMRSNRFPTQQPFRQSAYSHTLSGWVTEKHSDFFLLLAWIFHFMNAHCIWVARMQIKCCCILVSQTNTIHYVTILCTCRSLMLQLHTCQQTLVEWYQLPSLFPLAIFWPLCRFPPPLRPSVSTRFLSAHFLRQLRINEPKYRNESK